jgi:5-methylcytosine-specific restriction protein B
MAIPSNISKQHLLQTIEKIDTEGIPSDGDSQYYDVLYKGKKYPPKVLVSYANIFANGKELGRKTFAGGLGTPCFKLLQEMGLKLSQKKIMLL